MVIHTSIATVILFEIILLHKIQIPIAILNTIHSQNLCLLANPLMINQYIKELQQ